MATLIKEHEGLMLNESFEEASLLWNLAPSDVDCLRFNQDGLRILHNSEYTTYTMKEPNGEYCAVAQIHHIPVTKDDVAGIIVLADTQDYAECQSYLSEKPSNIGNYGVNTTFDFDLSDRYIPYSFNDEGLNTNIMLNDNTDNESLTNEEEGESTDPSSPFIDKFYQFIKFIRYGGPKYSYYRFFASVNGIDDWIEVGNTTFSKNCSIGFFLYSTEDENVLTHGQFVVNNFYIYENRYITINGIKSGQEFEIFDTQKNKTLLRSDTTPGKTLVGRYRNGVKIDTTGILMPLKDVWIRIFPKHHFDQTIAQFDLENLTVGGDVFSINYDIRLIIDNEVVEHGTNYDLGYLYTNDFKQNVVVFNNDDVDLELVKISIIAYSEYYSGGEVVQIAINERNLEDSDHSNDVLENLPYSNSITIPELRAHTGVELIMKLSDIPKQEFYSVTNKYRFKLLIE